MLIVGQVLWLRTVLNVRGTVSAGEHPYLITKINDRTAATISVVAVFLILGIVKEKTLEISTEKSIFQHTLPVPCIHI